MPDPQQVLQRIIINDEQCLEVIEAWNLGEINSEELVGWLGPINSWPSRWVHKLLEPVDVVYY